MIHMRLIIISIVSVVTSTLCMSLFNIKGNTHDSAIYYILYGAVTSLVGMYHSVKSEYSFIERHNVRDVLSLCISCVVGVLSIIVISVILKLMSGHIIFSSILMIILICFVFDDIVNTAIRIHYPSDTNSKFIDDDDIDE